ncbi:MAG: hypothetical protein U1F23_10695 [Lysobacterales bacterium]
MIVDSAGSALPGRWALSAFGRAAAADFGWFLATDADLACGFAAATGFDGGLILGLAAAFPDAFASCRPRPFFATALPGLLAAAAFFTTGRFDGAAVDRDFETVFPDFADMAGPAWPLVGFCLPFDIIRTSDLLLGGRVL